MPSRLTAQVDGITFSASEFPPGGPFAKTLFCLPGGGANAEFFDLAPGHSFANRMSGKGYRVITMDHPGTATNPLPDDHPFLTPRQSADYIGKALDQWCAGQPLIGVGHSMGGMIITLLQARRRPFSGLALLGSSAGGLDWGLSEEEKDYIDKPAAFDLDIELLTLAKFKVPFPRAAAGPSGKSITFGGETPELTQHLRDITCSLYGAGGMMSMTRGSFLEEVESINVPMFFAFGDHDIGIPPADAPKDYINAPDTQLIILKDTGHNHLAFSSITRLCDRLDNWASSFL